MHSPSGLFWFIFLGTFAGFVTKPL